MNFNGWVTNWQKVNFRFTFPEAGGERREFLGLVLLAYQSMNEVEENLKSGDR